ncbi:MAG: hypothetical protein M3487_05075 [Actinomycetota bacterium]|nr:hypothetical protein [Actinomycetota bacterium]
MSDAAEIEEAVEHPHRPPPWAPLTLVAFVGLIICTNIANVVWSRWASTNPEGLLALSSRQRYLVLAVAGGISPGWYVVIGAGRLALAFVVCHLIGRAYRDQALSWFTRFLGITPEALESYHRGFAKAEFALIPFFAGSNIVAVLTGIHKTPPARLAALLAIGLAGRLALMWWLAKAFESQLLDVLAFLQRYQWWAIGISLALVVAVNVRNVRRGTG